MIQESSSLKNQELTLKNWTIELQDDPETGELILPFPEDMLEETGWKEGDMTNAENYYKHCISLPMYPTLTHEEQDFVIEKIKQFYG